MVTQRLQSPPQAAVDHNVADAHPDAADDARILDEVELQVMPKVSLERRLNGSKVIGL